MVNDDERVRRALDRAAVRALTPESMGPALVAAALKCASERWEQKTSQDEISMDARVSVQALPRDGNDNGGPQEICLTICITLFDSDGRELENVCGTRCIPV
jgi:hypothetical protein